MMSNDEKLEKMHIISMKLLKAADEAMAKTNCRYMLDAGTLLGAVRHKDFIPWDDDCDICMLRDEYERFLEKAESCFFGEFEFINPQKVTDNRFYDFVPKIIYKKVSIDKGSADDVFYNGKYSHPALDIFVIDKVPETKIGQMLHTKLLILIYGLAMGHRRELDYSKYSKAEGLIVWILSKIGKIIPLGVTAAMYDGAAKMFSGKNKTKVMSTHSAMDHFGDVYEYEWYAGMVQGDIREEKFPVPVGYEGILKKHYKDYMSLPPVEKRVPKHLDFEKIQFGDE